MNPKRILMISTMAFMISIGGTAWLNDLRAYAWCGTSGPQEAASPDRDELLRLLDVTDGEMHEALYNGKTLADIAHDKQIDVQRVIDLQVAELAEQLDARLASGNITQVQYEEQRSELAELIANSVYGRSTVEA